MGWALAESLGEIFAHLGAHRWRSMLRRESNHVRFLFKKSGSLYVIYIN